MDIEGRPISVYIAAALVDFGKDSMIRKALD